MKSPDLSLSELRELIKYHAAKYYEGEEEISDSDFDELTSRLSQISPNDDLFKIPGWGYKPDEKSSSNHLVKIEGFDKKLHYPEDAKGYLTDIVIMPKFDGLTIEAYYQNNNLIKALTRGDGITGKVHTDKVSLMLNNQIKCDTGNTFVRGEVFIPVESQVILQSRGITRIRNYAVGVLKRDDNTDIEHIKFMAYTLHATNQNVKTKIQALEVLRNSGFMTTPYKHYDIATIEDFLECYTEWSKLYPIDGIVICKNNLIINDGIIEEDAIAYKFPGEKKNVKTAKITVDAGTTGKITPVVWFEEKVELCDAMVEKATGHNMGMIYNNKINVGSVLTITRSGDVIPYILDVVEPSDTPFTISKCPVCDSDLEWTVKFDKDGHSKRVNQFCRNPNCQAKVKGAIYKFLSIVGVPKGLGSTYVDNYIDNTKSTSLADFIAFHDGNVRALDVVNVGPHFMALIQTMIDKIHDKIKAGFKYSEFWYFINIPDLGNTISGEKLYATDPRTITLDDITNLYNQKIIPVHVYNNMLYKYDYIIEYSKLVSFIKCDNIKVDITMQVAVTGKTKTPRKMLETELKGYGIKCGGVSKKTTCVVCDETQSDSDKFVKAKELGIPIISEEEFRKKYL